MVLPQSGHDRGAWTHGRREIKRKRGTERGRERERDGERGE